MAQKACAARDVSLNSWINGEGWQPEGLRHQNLGLRLPWAGLPTLFPALRPRCHFLHWPPAWPREGLTR